MWKILFAVISAVSTASSCISLLFDVKRKKVISKRRFILIVSILALIISIINLEADGFSFGKNGNLPNSDNSVDDTTIAQSAIEDSPSSESTTQLQDEHTPGNLSHHIKSINPNPVTFSPIAESDCFISPIDIESKYGSINVEGDICEYEFIPENNGSYRFELSDVPDGTDLRISITNSGGERLESGYDLDNGDGITASLHAGDCYYVKVEYYENYGDFTLNIGKKKPVTDVSNATRIFDSIQYSDQENDYSFTPSISGTYRFDFSDVPDGTDLKLQVFNSGWEQIKSDYDLDDGDGITIPLDAQHTYYIRVTEYENLGNYTLNIGHKKAVQAVSQFSSVSDAIQYTHQENDYSFIPAISGSYRFEFSNVPDGTDLKLYILNSGWEQMSYAYDLDNGDGITITLDANKTYYIRVTQYENIGIYTLNIGCKKAIVDISSYASITDSIQYTDQENDYLFAPSSSGDYRFEFSDVPDATYFKLYIFNSGWEQIKYDYGLDNGDGITVSMDVGYVYYIRVMQYSESGEYTLNVITNP